jgi:hypothetical protein
MLETDKVFAGSIPENYDRYMVPLIFEPFATDIARRAASMSPKRRSRNRRGPAGLSPAPRRQCTAIKPTFSETSEDDDHASIIHSACCLCFGVANVGASGK